MFVKQSACIRYQDYVIKEGRYIGRFEEMYRNSSEVPWHQDQTVNAIFSDLTVAILRYRQVTSLLDVGCGLGYMANRLYQEIPQLSGGRVVGLDVSPTAITTAQTMFPHIEFYVGTLNELATNEKFQVVVSKDVLWYVLDDLPGYLQALASRSSNWVYIGQSFPENRPFYGEDVLPDAEGLCTWLEQHGHRIVYSVVERDVAYGGREYVHILIDTMA